MGKNKNHTQRQHGDKTHAKQAEIAQSGDSRKKGESGPHHDPADIQAHNDPGKDRLFEKRVQHDDAEKESERTRLSRDINKHKHDAVDESAAGEPDVTG